MPRDGGPNPIPPQSIGRGLAADADSPSRSLAFASNQVRQYAPVPVVLGRHRVVPPLAAKPTTRVEANGDVYQTVPVLWGYGPLGISEIKIGTTPVADYADATVETREGRPRDAAFTLWTDTITNLSVRLAISVIDIRLSDQLPRRLTEINGIANSGDDNPAVLFREVLQHPARRTPAPDSAIDAPTLGAFEAFCDGEGYAFSGIVDFNASVWEILSEICSVARAQPRFHEGKWTVVWDSGTQDIEGHITGANAANFRIRKSFGQAPHAMRVKFPNESKQWQLDERLVYRSGYDADSATDILEVSPFGITDADNAWRYAIYQLAQAEAPERWSAQQSLESLEVVRGMHVTCQHDTLRVGIASTRIMSVTRDARDRVTAVALESPVRLDAAGADYRAKVRTRADANLRLTLDQDGDETVDELAVDPPVDDDDIAAGDLITIGTDGDLVEDALVVGVERGDDFTASVRMIPWDADVYAAVSRNPPAFVSALDDLAELLPNLVIEAVSSDAANRQTIGNVIEPRIVLDVEAIAVAGAVPEIQIREAAAFGEDENAYAAAEARIVSPTRCVVAGVNNDQRYDLRLRWTLAVDDRVGNWTEISHTVDVPVPDNPTNFAVALDTGGSRAFTWRNAIGRDVVGVQIRYSSGNVAWANMTLLHEGILTASPYYSYQPDAGTYYFEIRTINADGTGSAGVRLANIELPAVRSLGRFKELVAYRKVGVTAAAPARPTTGSYDFEDADYTPPNGWVETWPAHDADEVVYASAATATDADGDLWEPDANDWSSPAIVSDAADINIIYRRLSSAGSAPAPSAGIPAGWHDDAADVPAGSGFIHVSLGLRRRGATLFTWGTPEQLEGQAGIDGIVGADGTDGAPGEDGLSKEYIFAATSTAAQPSAPSDSWGFDNPQQPWNDAAPNLSATVQHLWRNQRTIRGAPSIGDPITADWEDIRLVGYYAENGLDGIDGLGVVSMFRNVITGVVTITYTDGTTDTFTVSAGQDGDDGAAGAAGTDGEDGTSVGIQSVATQSDGDIRVTFTDGTFFDVPEGAAGRGINRITRNLSAQTVAVTFDDGSPSQTFSLFDGADGRDGSDGRDGARGAAGRDGRDGQDGAAASRANLVDQLTIVLNWSSTGGGGSGSGNGPAGQGGFTFIGVNRTLTQLPSGPNGEKRYRITFTNRYFFTVE